MDPIMMFKALIALSFLVAPIAGCTTFGLRSERTGNLCPVGPFIGDPGASQRLTRAEKEYVASLNRSGEEICGWTPPDK